MKQDNLEHKKCITGSIVVRLPPHGTFTNVAHAKLIPSGGVLVWLHFKVRSDSD